MCTNVEEKHASQDGSVCESEKVCVCMNVGKRI